MDAAILERVRADLRSHGLRVLSEDSQRPWGGFLVLDESQIDQFVAAYFPGMHLPRPQDRLPMRPKILLIAPGRRFSWQYHHRRAEEWRVVEGPVGVAVSDQDVEPEPLTYEAGRSLRLPTGTRHRLYGLKDWGVVAEIWVHTDPTVPSDDDDIVRLTDDYNR